MAVGDKKPVVMEEDMAVPGGIATLGTDGKLASEQIPGLEALGAIEYINSLPFTRRNLLDNWYFVDPIDQRGGYVVPPGIPYWTAMVDGTSPGSTDNYYKATVNAVRSNWYEFVMDGVTYYVPDFEVVRGYICDYDYSIDRWFANEVCVLLMNGFVRVICTGVTNSFFIHRTDYDFPGETMTFSIINSEENVLTGTAIFPRLNDPFATMIAFGNYNVSLFNIESECGVGIYFNTIGAYIDIKAAKIELGSTQTLAHQDADGNWVLNDPPPNRAQELAKCQRYFERIGAESNYSYTVGPGSVAMVNFKVSKRVTPVVTVIARDGIDLDVGYVSPEAFRVVNMTNSWVDFYWTANADL